MNKPFKAEHDESLLIAYIDLGGERVLRNGELDSSSWDEVAAEVNKNVAERYAAATLHDAFYKMGEEDNNFGRGWSNDENRALPATTFDVNANCETNAAIELDPYDSLIQRIAAMRTGIEPDTNEELIQRMKTHRDIERDIAQGLLADHDRGVTGVIRAAELFDAMRLSSDRMIDALQHVVAPHSTVMDLRALGNVMEEKKGLSKELARMVGGN